MICFRFLQNMIQSHYKYIKYFYIVIDKVLKDISSEKYINLI